MFEPLLRCLADPVTATALVTALGAVVAAVWRVASGHYQGRLAGQAEDIDRLRRLAAELGPENAASNARAYRELGRMEADREFVPRMEEKDREIRALTARLQAGPLPGPAADGAALAARLEVAERERRELERQREIAYGITDRLSQAALDSVALAQRKARDAARAGGQEVMAAGAEDALRAQLQAAAARTGGEILSVRVYGRRQERTRATVRGAELVAELLANGWLVPPPSDDYHAIELTFWSEAWHRVATARGSAPPMQRSAESDFVTCRIEDDAGVTYALAILGTLRNGWPSPMIKYFTGTKAAVSDALHAWKTEYRVPRG